MVALILLHCGTYNGLHFIYHKNLQSQPERAIRLFAKIVQKKVLPNIRTCELLFSLFGVVNGHYEDSDALSKVDVAKRINAIQKHMANNGIQHSHLSMNKLVSSIHVSFFM